MSEYTMEHLLRWDKQRDEPYMTLPSFPELRLTPHRREDGDEIMRLFNDPLIGSWAFRRPFPYAPHPQLLPGQADERYTEEDLQFVWDFVIPNQRATAASLKPLFTDTGVLLAGARPPPKAVYPFGLIRGPGGKLAGDIGTWYADRMPPRPKPSAGESASSAAGADTAKVSGTEADKGDGPKELSADFPFSGAPADLPLAEQIYELAYNLNPEWRGKGVGLEAVKVLLAWAKWMGVGKLFAHAELKNVASQAVLRKAKFTLTGSIQQPWPEERGGGIRTLTEWEYLCVAAAQPETASS